MKLAATVQNICQQFQIHDTFVSFHEIQTGNINHGYKVDFLKNDNQPISYFVQRLNTQALTNPILVMENIEKITSHIHTHYPDKLCLHYYHTENGSNYCIENDSFWRVTDFIPSISYDHTTNPRILYGVGYAFGEFQALLNDFSIDKLHTSIPNFHNTRARYAHFQQTIRQNSSKLPSSVMEDINWLLLVQNLACTLTDLQEIGALPLRITHNDTKINNVLFSSTEKKPLVVIDLDTIMPGLVAHDFGDGIRSAANTAPAGCQDPSMVGLDLRAFEYFSSGFLAKTATNLTPEELRTLAVGPFCITTELGLRYLDDYLSGHTSFKFTPDQLLTRARCQIALAKDMLNQKERMQEIITDLLHPNS